MKKAGSKNAGKQEHTVKDAKPKNGKKRAAAPRALPSERLGVPPTTPDVDMKLAAAENEPHSWTRPPVEEPEDAQNAPQAATAAEPADDPTRAPECATGEPGARAGQAAGAKTKSLSLIEAAVQILAQGAGVAMGCQEIVAAAVQRGLWAPRSGKTPASTLYAAILREIATKGEKSRFVKTERGRFALAATSGMA